MKLTSIWIIPKYRFCCLVTQSCLALCNSMYCSMPGFLVLQHLPELAQTHVHRVGNAIQPSHPLSSPAAFYLSQHQGLFLRVTSSHQVAKVLELQLQHQSFQWILRVDFLGLTGLISLSPRDSQESSSTPHFESINSLAFRLLYGPTLTSIYECWKNHKLWLYGSLLPNNVSQNIG